MRTPNALTVIVVSIVALTSRCAAQDAKAGGGLLIIAPDEFVEALRPYAIARGRDLPTRLVALSDALKQGDRVSFVGANPAFDDAERLKRFLFFEWHAGGAGYALLVGDADVLPVRYMCLDRVTEPAFDYAFYPSDLYYADLARANGAFDDWNAQRDGFHGRYFGEVRGEKNKSDPINFDAIDYKPEIAVGRWPVSTPEQATAVAAKTLWHAEAARAAATPQDAAPASPRAALIACGGWIENRPAMDALAQTLASSRWSVEKRYFKDDRRDDQTPPPDAQNVIALANDGCAVIIHSGHGSDNSWEHSITLASIGKITGAGGRLPVMMSAGCSTARLATLPPYEAYVDADGATHKGTNNGEVFAEPPPPPACYQRGEHNPSGLGEQLLRAADGGAVAYIGCNTGSQPCGMTLAEGFVKSLPNGESGSKRLGDCWNAAIAHYWEAQHLATIKPVEGEWYPASIFFQGMKFMLFGDPSLRIG